MQFEDFLAERQLPPKKKTNLSFFTVAEYKLKLHHN